MTDKHISVPPYVVDVLSQLTRMGYAAYVVGGCVRDSLLGREPADWDVCTAATPDEMLAVFRRFRVLKTGLKHGTLTVRSRGHSVEVTTFRTDGVYSDNRHPDAVTFVSEVEDDLSRRDFTINAMAYHPDHGIVDAFGGQQDLADHMLRCVGEPDMRFQEDGLRILRALRFAARFQFAVERETAYAVHRNRHLLENISAERIYKELQGILVSPGVGDMLTAFPQVFATIMPELMPLIGCVRGEEDLWMHITQAVCAAPADFALRLVMLMHETHADPAAAAEQAAAALSRLKSDGATALAVTTLLREFDLSFPTTRAGMRRLIGRLGQQRVQQLFTLRQAHLRVAPNAAASSALRAAMLLADETLAEQPPAFTTADLTITGRDLISLGLKPGPAFGKLLAALLSEVQDETLPNTREALICRARRLCAE